MIIQLATTTNFVNGLHRVVQGVDMQLPQPFKEMGVQGLVQPNLCTKSFLSSTELRGGGQDRANGRRAGGKLAEQRRWP